MIKTIIVDDHKLFSEGIVACLHNTGRFEVIGTYPDGRSLLNYIQQLNPDMLLMDIEMPELNGLDALKRIRVSNKTVKIVVLSMHNEPAFLYEAKALGANGYLTKAINGNQLVESLIEVFNGGDLFPILKPIECGYDNLLSAREIEILRHLKKGLTNEGASGVLNISPHTVKVHRRNMMRKLKAKNSLELLSKALEMGYL